ncbi:hypothetical protein A9D14_00980 [Croceicoccus marinus]|uniref:Beta-lactamase-related domain-containing protein n=2 Tax=Croceicoccus marinus TaxID=450378 RepID=A0A1Z1F8F8_9SPHN|nr:hypothetical protein A9D14_00980 [Croceicoccus marinus]
MPKAEDQLRWTAGQKLVGHRNMHLLFPSGIVEAGQNPYPLTTGEALTPEYSFDGGVHSLDDYFERTGAVALLVLKDDRIVLERYTRGDTAQTVSASRSMAKSVTSTLLGAAIARGDIASIDDTVATYVPELADTRYGPVTLRQLVTMSSGVHYYENPADPNSDLTDLQGCFGSHKGCLLEFLHKIGTRPQNPEVGPGTSFHYSTADAVLNGIVVEHATGMSLPRFLSEAIWQRFGMEDAAYWNMETTDGSGFGGSGFGATLRDYGRLGLFLLHQGRLRDGTSALPHGWLAQATTPTGPSIAAGRPYGFAWWLPKGSVANSPQIGIGVDEKSGSAPMTGQATAYYGMGSAGQVLLINPAERVVIVKWAAWPDEDRERNGREDAALFAAIVNSLHR